MAIVANKSYWFKSKSDSKYLNPLTSGSLANSTNVTTYAKESGDASKIWICSYYSNSSLNLNGYLLKNSKNTNFALDRWRLSGDNYNNADIYTIGTSSEDLKDQLILIEETTSGCRIKLKYRNLYLTRSFTTTYGGFNVNWQTYDGSNNQLWIAEDGPSEVVITGMPSDAGYTNNTEYFHPETGMIAGTWESNGGANKETQIKNYYKTLYNISYDPTNAKALYSLWGGKYLSTEPDYPNQFHPGLDVDKGLDSDIYATRSGTIVAKDNWYVTIKPYQNDCYLVYVHLKVRDEIIDGTITTVTAGQTILGKENKLRTSKVHTHIEAHSINDTYLKPCKPAETVLHALNTIEPYSHLNEPSN